MDALQSCLSDPVLTRGLAAVLAVVLLVGTWQKLRDMVVFAGAVENYRLLPEAAVLPAAWGIALLETAAGCLWLIDGASAAASAATVLLLLTVTGAVGLNLVRGHRDIDCGCGGLSSQPLSAGLVVRNLILLAAAVLAGQEAGARSLELSDYLTTGGLVLALLGLYVSANQLMANAPRVAVVRR